MPEFMSLNSREDWLKQRGKRICGLPVGAKSVEVKRTIVSGEDEPGSGEGDRQRGNGIWQGG